MSRLLRAALAQGRLLPAALALALLFPAGARAAVLVEGETLRLDLGGDVKGFFYEGFGYEPQLPEGFTVPEGVETDIGDFALGAFDFRLKLQGSVGRWLRFDVHHVLTATTQWSPIPAGGSVAANLFAPGTVSGETAQVVDLSWSDEARGVAGRIDRLALAFRFPGFDVTVGRQPITFGSTYFFTPMDIVAPFSPYEIDREYKPGVDAVRADAYFGFSTKLTLVAAYAGAFDVDGSVVATHGQTTFGVWDVGLFLGAVYGDVVFGANTAGSLGPVAVRSEATVTFPNGDRGSPFVRAVIGADHRFESTLTLSGEVYVQSLGPIDPAEYLAFAQTDRVRRGEIWALGRWYAAVSASYELLPILTVNAFAMCNLVDPSFLVGPGLSWSVADEAELSAGAYFGVGERPEVRLDPANPLVLNSEFGFVPTTAYALLKTYF